MPIGTALAIIITRWTFKVNKFEKLLQEISKKMDTLPKEKTELNDLIGQETAAQKNARLYRQSFNN